MFTQTTAQKNNWIAKPLGRKGDLNSWIDRMAAACPNPIKGQVVWLENDKNSIGYKVLGFKKMELPSGKEAKLFGIRVNCLYINTISICIKKTGIAWAQATKNLHIMHY